MTVGDNLHKALTAAEALKAQIETFGHETSDKTAKADFYRMAQTMEQQVVTGLRNRTNYVEQQEPQYNVKQQAYQAAQQQMQQQGQQKQPPQH